MQPEFDEHAAVRRDNHAFGSCQVTDDLGAHFVRSGRHAHEDELSPVARLHAGAQLGNGNLHRLDRLTAHGVDNDSGDGARLLRGRRARGHRQRRVAEYRKESPAEKPQKPSGVDHEAASVGVHAGMPH